MWEPVNPRQAEEMGKDGNFILTNLERLHRDTYNFFSTIVDSFLLCGGNVEGDKVNRERITRQQQQQ